MKRSMGHISIDERRNRDCFQITDQPPVIPREKSASETSPLISSKPVSGQRSVQRGRQHEATFERCESSDVIV